MDEARRFLRYVTPGLTFAVQTLVLLFIINAAWTIDRLGDLKKDAGVGLAVALFLASGGLGYLFSVVHHTLHHRRWASAIDHRPVVKRLSEAGLLDLRTFDGTTEKKVDINKIDRTSAWVVVTAVWRQRLQPWSRIQAADAGASALTDLVHSAGAARVGAICALVTALWVTMSAQGAHAPVSSCRSMVTAIVVGLLLFALHQCNYRRTGRLALRFIDEVLTDALWVAKSAPDNPSGQVTVTFVEL